jgi:hypothetical protein
MGTSVRGSGYTEDSGQVNALCTGAHSATAPCRLADNP